MAASGGWCAADHLLQPLRVLLAAAGEGVDNDGQQHNQQLAHGRRLARQVTLARVLRAVPVVCEATGRATEARLIAFLDSVPSPVIGARRRPARGAATARFAADSLLEGDGFELPVPRERRYRDLTFCASSMSRRTRATAAPAKPRPSAASTIRRSKRSESRPIGTWNASPPSTATSMDIAIVSRAMPSSCILAGTSA